MRGKFNSVKIVVSSTLASVFTVMSLSSSVLAYDTDNANIPAEPVTAYSEVANQANTTNETVDSAEEKADYAADLILNGGEAVVSQSASTTGLSDSSTELDTSDSSTTSGSYPESDTPDTTQAPASEEEPSDTSSEGSETTPNTKTVLVDGVVEGEAGNVADPKIKDLKDAATEVKNDTNFEASKEDLDLTKTDLTAAHNADLEADKNAELAIDKVADMQETADDAAKLAKEANTAANAYIEAIGNATTAEEVAQQYDNLMNVVNTASGNLSDKRTLFDSLSGQYAKAIEDLTKAEQALDDALDDAGDDAQEALNNADIAKAKVDALKDAYDVAVQALETEQEQAQATETAIDGLSSSWDVQRNALQQIVQNYIIPQKTNGQAVNITYVGKGRGFDRQDNTYYEFSYTLNGEPVTEYYNYDRANKNYEKAAVDRYNHLGNSADIVIYQKTYEEIKADERLFEYYQDCTEEWYTLGVLQGKNKKSADGEILGYKELKERVNAGDFNVYASGSGEDLVVFCKAEIEADIAQNGADSAFKSDGEGGYIYKNNPLHLVVQNSKDNTVGERCVMNTSNCEEVRNFIANADDLVLKYAYYANAVNDAKDAVDDAKKEVEDLNDAIDELKDSRGNRIVTAIKALGVDDLSVYFGLDLPAEEAQALNEMTLKQAITYLTKLRNEAEEKLKKAELDLDELKQNASDLAPKSTTSDSTDPVAVNPSVVNTPSVNDTPAASTPATLPASNQENTSVNNTAVTNNPIAKAEPAKSDSKVNTDNTQVNVPVAEAPTNVSSNTDSSNTDTTAEHRSSDTENIPVITPVNTAPVISNDNVVFPVISNDNAASVVNNNTDSTSTVVNNASHEETVINTESTAIDSNAATEPVLVTENTADESINNVQTNPINGMENTLLDTSKQVVIPDAGAATTNVPETVTATTSSDDDTVFDTADADTDDGADEVPYAGTGAGVIETNNNENIQTDNIANNANPAQNGSVLGARRPSADNTSNDQAKEETEGSVTQFTKNYPTDPAALDNSLKTSNTVKPVVITDDDVAKASAIADTVAEKHHVSWWWLLFILLLIIIAYKIRKDFEKEESSTTCND